MPGAAAVEVRERLAELRPGIRITVSGLSDDDILPVADAIASATGAGEARRYE